MEAEFGEGGRTFQTRFGDYLQISLNHSLPDPQYNGNVKVGFYPLTRIHEFLALPATCISKKGI